MRGLGTSDVDGLRNAYRALRDILRRPAVYEGLAGLCRLLGAECGLTPLRARARSAAGARGHAPCGDQRKWSAPLPMEKRDPMDSARGANALRLRAEGGKLL